MLEFDATLYLRRKAYSISDFQRELDAQGIWFHRFEFTNGAVTNARDPSPAKLQGLHLPDLRGLSVIDIGAFDGYFSFQCEALGAARVLATDEICWSQSMNALSNFRLMRDVLNSRVEERMIAVEDLSRETVGQFDVSLFLGVLYHAANMMDYLTRLRAITTKVAVVESLVDLLQIEEPAAAFYPPGVLNNDSSNYWGPNIACVTEMLKRVGFSSVDFIGLWDKNTRAALDGKPVDGPVTSGRAVWHAHV
jgi:tRNA (mo5U34)-methyltransferase